jgi:hypothetical protein
MPTFLVTRLAKIYPSWDFWFENKPSGNPVGWQQIGLTGKTVFDRKFVAIDIFTSADEEKFLELIQIWENAGHGFAR